MRVCSSPRDRRRVDQDPQHGELFVVDHRPQPAHPGADQRDGVRVGGIGLAALAGGEDPCPRGQLRRDIDHALAFGQEPVGHVPADSLTALDSPDAVGPRLHVASHRLVSFTVSAETALAENGFVAGHDLDRD